MLRKIACVDAYQLRTSVKKAMISIELVTGSFNGIILSLDKQSQELKMIDNTIANTVHPNKLTRSILQGGNPVPNACKFFTIRSKPDRLVR